MWKGYKNSQSTVTNKLMQKYRRAQKIDQLLQL